jgi:Flp pilus assembly protein TadG
VNALISKIKSREEGQSLVEFALVIPIFLLLCLGTIQFGYILNNYLILSGVARDAARVGSVTNSDTKIKQTISNNNPTLEESQITITITPSETYRKRGDQLTVQLDYPIRMVLPMFEWMEGHKLVSAVTMRVE